ncbi:DUF3329 domain-containing protein [Tropicimonas sp. TH_r6]|uniref:DUF3329 domain-containing protein n=1 Tax=Tropicimonas sp. TH_r6 TaxID=3082085 RepID=UPI0029549F09|nr:DUF3329 domain-containing protein [Tropicimonas sp. TH_r6]MDV7143361.1 DUF3329 domain-containing protein [Tropicimonas sp. TH_r6]
MFNFDVPFFKPLWIRIATVAFAIGWGLVELAWGEIAFAMMFLAAGIYAAYRLFITFDPGEDS